jgi:hypothetical protein
MTICVLVPGEGELRLGAVGLPAGRLLRLADDTGAGWITQAPVREPGPAWSALSALHGETGLIPVLVPAGRGDDLEVVCQDPAEITDVDQVDATAILEHLWDESFPEPWQTGAQREPDNEWADEMAAPFTRQYPGLAPAVTSVLAPGTLDAALRSFPASRIALIPAGRPADARLVPG